MTRRRKGLAWFGAAVAIVVALCLVTVRTQSEHLAGLVADIVNARFAADRNIKLEVGDITGSLLRDIYVKDLTVTYTATASPRVLLAVPSAHIRYDLASLLVGNVKIDHIEIASPRIVVPRKANGKFIYPAGDEIPAAHAAASGNGGKVTIGRIRLSDVSLVLETEKPWVLKSAAVDAAYSRDQDRSTVTISNADLACGEAARIDTLSGVIISLADRVEIRDLHLRTPRTGLRAAGIFGIGKNDSLAAEASIDSLDLAEIPPFLGKPRLSQTSSLKGRVKVAGRYTKMAIDAGLSGYFDVYAISDLAFEAAYADSSLKVKRLDCVVNGSTVSLEGTAIVRAIPTYDGLLRFADLDLARFVKAGGADYSSGLYGSVRFSGRGLTQRDLNVTVWPDLTQGRYREWGFDSVKGRISVTPSEVAVDTLLATVRGTRVSTTGKLGMDGSGSLDFALDCPRLDDLYAYHKVKGLGGELTAHAAIEITKGDLAISATSLGRGIDYAGAYLESLLVDGDLTRKAGHWGGSLGIFGSTVNVRGFKAGEIRGNVAVEDTTLEIKRLAVTRPDGDLVGARGEVRIHNKDLLIRIDDLMIQMVDYMWQNRDPIEIAYVGDSLAVSSFVMASEIGRISLANSVFSAGRYRLSARVDGLDLGRLKQAVGKEMPTGILSLALDVSGTGGVLEFDLGFDVRGGEMRSVEFAALSGTLAYAKGNLAIKQISLEENGGNVAISGAMPLDLTPSRLSALSKAGKLAEVVDDLGQVTIQVSNMDISVLWPLVPPLTKLKGLADVELTLGGRRDNPRVASRGRLGGAYYGQTAVGDVSWDLALGDSTLEVVSLGLAMDKEAVRLAGRIPLAVSVLPFSSIFPARPMDLTLTAENGALDLLCEIFPKFKVCSGTYGADLRIGGTMEDPTFTGSANLAGGRLRFEGVPQDIEEIYLDAEAQGKRFEVTKMVAEKGALKAKGFFALEGVRISDYDFQLALKELAITEFEDFYVVLSGSVSVKAQPIEMVGIVPSIEGSIVVEEGEYYYSLGAGSGGGGGGAMGPEAAPTWTMNLGVEIPHDFWVRGNDIDAELQGSLNVKKGAEGLLVLGTMQTIRGTFYIYNNDFRISKGEFRFADVKSLKNVYIDLEATSRVLDERIDIAAKGSMENLDVTATSESGWSETQIFEALTLRRGVAAEGAPRSRFFSDEFLRSWGVALVNRFGSGVARELRLDQFGVEVGDGSQGSVLSATRVTFGKYVSDKVYLQYTQALGSLSGGAGKLTQRGLAFPERQFQVEYRLSDRFSMEGEAGTVGGLGYFDVDLKFTYGY